MRVIGFWSVLIIDFRCGWSNKKGGEKRKTEKSVSYGKCLTKFFPVVLFWPLV